MSTASITTEQGALAAGIAGAVGMEAPVVVGHTPGDWIVDWNVSRLDIFSADASTLIATIRRSTLSSGIDKTAVANARLIAAAPDLLAALQDVYSDLEIGAHPHLHIEQIRAAITRATGGGV